MPDVFLAMYELNWFYFCLGSLPDPSVVPGGLLSSRSEVEVSVVLLLLKMKARCCVDCTKAIDGLDRSQHRVDLQFGCLYCDVESLGHLRCWSVLGLLSSLEVIHDAQCFQM